MKKIEEAERKALAKLTPDWKDQAMLLAKKHGVSLLEGQRMLAVKYLVVFAYKGEIRTFEAACRNEQGGKV